MYFKKSIRALLLAHLLPLSAIAIILPASTYAADNSAAAVEVVSSLLTTARTHLNAQYARFKTLLADKTAIDQASETLQNKLASAELATQNALQELNLELDKLFALNTQMIVMPEIVGFHADLAAFAQRYRQQAGLTVTNPIPGVVPLPGLFYAVRAAMGEIADSLGDYLESERDVLVFYRNMLNQISDELRELSLSDANVDLLRYGTEHYISTRSVIISEGGLSLTLLPAVQDGIRADGVVTQVPLPCTPVNTLINFRSQLTSFRPLISSFSGTFAEFQQGPLLALNCYYNDCENIPGKISHYGACRATLADRITILLASKQIAEIEGNMILAADFDRQINDLISEDNHVLNELKLVQYRSNQVTGRMVAAGSAQAIDDNPPNAWKVTLESHVDNLNNVGPIGVHLYRAGADLMERANTEILSLRGVTEPDRRGRMSQVATKITSISQNGFDKLLLDLDFAITSTRIFAGAVRRGDLSLAAVMGTYESAIAQQSNARTEDLSLLPPTITATEAAIVQKRAVYEQTVVFRQDVEAKVATFQSLYARFFSKEEIFERVVGVVQLNPIYTSLVAKLFSKVTSEKDYQAEVATVDAAVRNFMAEFEGIQGKTLSTFATASAQTQAEIKKLCKNKFKKITDKAKKKKKIAKCIAAQQKNGAAKWIGILSQQRDAMVANVEKEANEASQVHLEGDTVGGILTQMTSDRDQLLQLAK